MFPSEVRALCIVAIDVLCGFTDQIADHNEFDLFLKRISKESVLAET